jgi:hypothetical protein
MEALQQHLAAEALIVLASEEEAEEGLVVSAAQPHRQLEDLEALEQALQLLVLQ